ncbi:MAG: CBS domain-containing protein [Cellvibrionaceae bacterium]
MVFQVYDQGNRIQTPWNEIFPPKHVNKLEATAATHAPSLSDELKEGNLPHELQDVNLKAYRKVKEGISDPEQVTRAHQLMSESVITLPASFTLAEAWSHFQQYGYRHFPVVNGRNKLVGILSDRDFFRVTSKLQTTTAISLERTHVKDIMTARVLTATPDIHIRELAEVMLGHRIGAMVFVGGEQSVVGILTRTDILRALVHHAPIELWI